MPSGRVHATITAITSGVSFLWLYQAGEPLHDAGTYALGCLSGILLTPDLDVAYTASNAAMDDIGYLPGLIWSLVWWPYSKIPHRHWLSHGLVIGTLGRAIYVWIALAIILRHWPHFPAWWPLALAGLMTADNLHIGADWLVTTWTRRARPGTQNRGIKLWP